MYLTAHDHDYPVAYDCFITCLDTGVVLELVASGTLALQLTTGHGYSWSTFGADTSVSVARLRQTQ